MSKGFENGTIVPLASKRLRSAGTCEVYAQDDSRARDRKLYPILDQGAMMSAQNWQAYIQAQQRERMYAVMREVQERIAQRRSQPKQQPSQVGTVLPFRVNTTGDVK